MSSIKCVCCRAQTWHLAFTSPDRMYGNDALYQTYQCENCGLYRLDTSYDLEKISSYYPKSSYYSYQSNNGLIRLKIRLYAFLFSDCPDMISHLRTVIFFPLMQLMRGIKIQKSANVIDIGCGSGKFLRIVKALGMFPYGAEINDQVPELLLDVTDQMYVGSFEALSSEFSFSKNPTMKFELVLSNHVIEHTTNPLKFLKQVKRLLSQDGTAIIATPNPDSIWVRIFGTFWAQLDSPRHLYLIGEHSMKRFCEDVGLEIVSIRHLGNEFAIAGSMIYLLEAGLGYKIPSRIAGFFLVFSKVVLLPIYSLTNIFRTGDTLEYHLKHHTI